MRSVPLAMRGDDIVLPMSIHERRVTDSRGTVDVLDWFRKLRGAGPAVLLDGPTTRILFDPFAIVAVPAGSDRSRRVGARAGAGPNAADPFARLFAALAPFTAEGRRGGAAGLLGYDLGRWLERLPDTAELDTSVSDLWFALFDRGVEIDRATGVATLFVEELPGRTLEEPPEQILERAARAIAGTAPPLGRFEVGPIASNFTRDDYLVAVERVREFIRDGEVYQANLSQRFGAAFDGDPLAVGAKLRAINPAPYGAVVACGEFTVISASPELFVAKHGDVALTRPIKGTRPRGDDAAADARLEAELIASVKDGAELAMIVDLERNDLGKVARFGSVEVVDAGSIERHPTVFHRVATVRARLRAGAGAEELLRATFPGGSITGCPKIRAMEVIEELERLRRGVFTGAIGFIGFDGDLALNVAIRTLVFERGRVHFHAGGGIVLDSDPAAEHAETLVKAAALARALGVARLA